MGFLDRLLGGSSSRAHEVGVAQPLDARGDDYLEVVGESFHHSEFDAITGGRPGDYPMQLFLVREPRNPYDANAVAIFTASGQQLGHLARGDAAICARRLDGVGGRGLVDGRVHREPEHQNWSAVLYVDLRALGLA